MAEDTRAETIKLGTEAWNVADAYVKLKVLKQLVLCDKLEIISLHGTEDIDEEGLFDSEMIVYRRVNSLIRLKDNLKQLISNVAFAIKPEDKLKLETLRGRVNIVADMIGDVFYTSINDVTKQNSLSINEEFFSVLLNELQEIKESIHFPVNNAGLIFRQTDQLDFDELINDIVMGG